LRLDAPRPTFALDMNDQECEIMARHTERWGPMHALPPCYLCMNPTAAGSSSLLSSPVHSPG